MRMPKPTKQEAEKPEEVVPDIFPFRTSESKKCSPDIYFEPSKSREADGSMVASVRGRPLRGSEVSLPEGYKGAMVEYVNANDVNDPNSKTPKVQYTFSKLNVWNLSLPVENSHPINKVMGWVKIAEAMHS